MTARVSLLLCLALMSLGGYGVLLWRMSGVDLRGRDNLGIAIGVIIGWICAGLLIYWVARP